MRDFLCKATFVSLLWFSGSNVLLALNYPIVYLNSIVYPVLILGTITMCYMNFPIFKETNRIEKNGLYLFFICAIFLVTAGRGLYTINYYSVCVFPILYSVILRENIKKKKNINFLVTMLIVFFVANSCIAIFERLFLHNFLPDCGGILQDFSQKEGFRSVALTGYPLGGAFFSMTMSLFILFSRLQSKEKIILFTLGLLSLLCFNSRAAIAGLGLGTIMFFMKIFFKKNNFKSKIYIILLSLLVFFCLRLLFDAGFGDRMFDFGKDESSDVRADNLALLSFLEVKELLWGMSAKDVEYMTLRFGGATSIIENPWLNYILRYGLVFLLLLCLYYFILFKNLFKGFPVYDICVVSGIWLIVQSSNNGFSASCDTSIVLLMTIIYAFKIINKSNSKSND